MNGYSNSSLKMQSTWGPVHSGMSIWVMSPNKPLIPAEMVESQGDLAWVGEEGEC